MFPKIIIGTSNYGAYLYHQRILRRKLPCALSGYCSVKQKKGEKIFPIYSRRPNALKIIMGIIISIEDRNLATLSLA